MEQILAVVTSSVRSVRAAAFIGGGRLWPHITFIHMDLNMFKKLLGGFGPHIIKEDAFGGIELPPGFRLAITLRYVSIGIASIHCSLASDWSANRSHSSSPRPTRP